MTATTTGDASTDRPTDAGPFPELRSTDPIDLAPRLTVLLLIPAMVALPGPLIFPLLVAAAVAADRRLLHHPLTWTIACAVASWHTFGWTTLNEHALLVVYWTGTLALAFWLGNERRTMAIAAALLVGLTFTLAVGVKVASPDYRAGAFFEFELITDPRFEPVAEWAGGQSDAEFDEGRAAYEQLRDPTASITTVEVHPSDRVTVVAALLTWGAIAVEAAAAVAFLCPRGWRFVPQARLATLSAFCLGAYLIVPIAWFGLALVVLGLAQCDQGSRDRYGYLALFGFLLLWPPLWQVISQGT